MTNDIKQKQTTKPYKAKKIIKSKIGFLCKNLKIRLS